MKWGVTMIGILLIALSVVFYLKSFSFPPPTGKTLGPSVWPQLMACLLMVLSGLMIFNAWRTREEAVFKGRYYRAALAAVVMGLYIWLSEIIGYIVTTIFFIFIILYLAGERDWRLLIIFPLGFTAFLYLVFYYLIDVPLPAGALTGF
ncbi:MAG: putative tricarboxylic transport rane protein [Clostridia bacterium]|nr:putative tricarboxylic transport rane protein [Clostridia bacterium]